MKKTHFIYETEIFLMISLIIRYQSIFWFSTAHKLLKIAHFLYEHNFERRCFIKLLVHIIIIVVVIL